MSSSPSTHDHAAFRNTDFGRGIYAGLLGDFSLFAGNSYACGPNFIVLGDDDDFNYEQSRIRMNIECAFGELIRRGGDILARTRNEILPLR